jgi:hypothetical protein
MDFILAHAFWSWMALGAIFLAIEVTTGSGWLLWPAGSAALTAVAAQLLRIIRGAPPAPNDVNNPLARLVGHKGEAATSFEGDCGRVFVDGKEWSAVLDGPGPLAAGAKVEVLEVLGGARLRVRAG